MRYLLIMIAVALTMLFTSACQEETQPVAKEVPKVIEQEKKEAATAVETAKENTEKVMEHIKEEAHKSMDHAKEQAHMMRDASDEKMAETQEKMAETHDAMTPASFSEEMLATGKMVYVKACAACHATGVAGAPKIGDKEAWSAHIEHGFDHMVETAIKGKGAMPAKGGNASLSDDEVKAAVSYIVEQSR